MYSVELTTSPTPFVPPTEYVFYCKRASVPPAFVAGGGQTRRAERGMGVNILEDERNTVGLPSYSKICTLWSHPTTKQKRTKNWY
jgi:hypothetical protein